MSVEAETREQVRTGGAATIWLFSAVTGPLETKVRNYAVLESRPYAQYDKSVTIRYTEPRKRSPKALTIMGNERFVTVEVAGEVVYDSRFDIPVDMDEWNEKNDDFKTHRPGRIRRYRDGELIHDSADDIEVEPPPFPTTTEQDTTPMVMTTTSIATRDEPIDAELVEPLSKKAAEALDKKIRAASDRLVTHRGKLIELLDEAARGEIHVALGFPSWTAWVKDAVQIQVTDAEERKQWVQLMSGKGMSTRAIAGSLRISKSQAARDAAAPVPDGAPEDELAKARKSKGLDGKDYPASRIPPKKKPKPVEPEPLDVEEVDDPLEPPRQREVTSSTVPDRCVTIPTGYHMGAIGPVDGDDDVLFIEFDPDADGPTIRLSIEVDTAWELGDLIHEYFRDDDGDD